MLFLDQRGTGLSTTVTAAGLGKVGGVREQVGYLKKFRADSIGESFCFCFLFPLFSEIRFSVVFLIFVGEGTLRGWKTISLSSGGSFFF